MLDKSFSTIHYIYFVIINGIKSPSLKNKVNSKTKFRVKFRPFVLAILDTELNQYFQNTH